MKPTSNTAFPGATARAIPVGLALLFIAVPGTRRWLGNACFRLIESNSLPPLETA